MYIRDMNSLRVNFNLEVLHGCKWSCVGCYVDTKAQSGFVNDDLEKFKKLTHSFRERELIPSILILGPTDIFTAGNRVDFLSNEDFIELSKEYERLTLTTTFQELDYDVLRILATKYQHLEVEFKIIIDLPVFNDDEFLLNVQQKMNEAKLALIACKKFVVHPQLNLFNAPVEEMRRVLSNYISINERSYRFFDEGVDYAISFGRRAIPKDYQYKAFQLLKDVFNTHISNADLAKNVHFDTGNLMDIRENIFTYRNGEFFFAPKLYDEYVNFDQRYKINVTRWHADEFVDFQRNLLIKQYQDIEKLPCHDCAYTATCVDKGAVDFLSFLGTNECIFPRRAIDLVNRAALLEKEAI